MTRDWRFGAALGLFLALLALQLAMPRLDADQAVTGLMGLSVLRGELPVFFWKQDHAGVPESYGAAVTFFLLGPSRLALSLVPALAALGYVLLLASTARLLFGSRTTGLAVLYATVVSPYVASHYVLARAYYIEHLLVGQVLLLGAALWLARGRDLSPAARERSLVVMGLAGGLGLYFGFQIAVALVPAALALLLVDPRLPLRRGAWTGLAAFLAGSAPFWLYNLTRHGATFATGVRFQGEQTAGEAARILLVDLVPIVLGVQDYVGTPPYLPGPLAMVVPAVVGAAAAWLLIRVATGLSRLRRDPGLAGEALVLVAAAACLGAVWAGRFLHVPRYLVPLAPPLALLLARATQLLWARSRAATVVLAGAYLLGVGLPLLGSLAVLWPAGRAEYRQSRADDEALFTFLQARGLTSAYAFEYWLAPRLTFDAGERIVVAQPFNDRYPPYTARVDASTRPAYVLRADVDRFAGWLQAAQVRAARADVGPYTVFWDFAAPPPAPSLPRAAWHVTGGPGRGSPERVIDGNIRSGWASAPGPPGSAWIEVDLGVARTVAGLVLVTDRAEHGPQVLTGAFEDPGGGPPVRHTLDTGGMSVLWLGGAPRVVPARSLTARFPPVTTRRIRLTEEGPAGSWAIAELFLLAPPEAAGPAPEPAGDRGGAARLVELGRAREAMRRHPDDPSGYVTYARLLEELSLPARSRLDEAAGYSAMGLVDEAREIYTGVAASLGPGFSNLELAERRAQLADTAGDPGEAEKLRDEVRRVREAGTSSLEAVFGRRVVLEAVTMPSAPGPAGGTLAMTYRWRLLGPTPRPLAATVHFRGPRHRFVDDHVLPSWLPGLSPESAPQHLLDERRVTIPRAAPPGRYRVVVGVWDPATRSPLRLFRWGILPTLESTVEIGEVEVGG